MAVSRLKLANLDPLVTLKYHKYQHLFMTARRLRVCVNGHRWSYVNESGLLIPFCPTCGEKGQRPYDSLLLRAGRRGGKTRIGALAVIEELATPGVRWWCCAPTYPKLNDYVLPAFFQQIPQAWLAHPGCDWSESELTLTLPNRAMVQFRSLEDPDRGRGPGLDGVWIDEICELSLKHWETIEPALADRGGIVIATTSPKGEDWVHETFYLPAERGDAGFWACSFTTLDNPSISKEFVARARARMSDLMFRQEYLAEVVSFTGAIYGDLVQRSTIEGTDEEMRYYLPEWPQIDPSRMAITGLDPGTDHPFAAIHLVGTPKGLIAVGEYEQANALFQIHAQRIQSLRRGSQSRVAIDRSQAQAQIELAQYGLYTTAAENSLIAGINRVSAWMLKNLPGAMPSGLVLPRRYTPLTIKRLNAYRWSEKNTTRDGQASVREQVYKKYDDLCDALRYALMTYPVLPESDVADAKARTRDLSGLPDQVRREIERERKSRSGDELDGLERMDDDLVPMTGMGDFTHAGY